MKKGVPAWFQEIQFFKLNQNKRIRNVLHKTWSYSDYLVLTLTVYFRLSLKKCNPSGTI